MFDRAEASPTSAAPTQIDCYVGEKIRTARERRAASPEELADAVGTSLSSIARYEAGQQKVSPLMLYKIATTLDVTLGSLFGMEKG